MNEDYFNGVGELGYEKRVKGSKHDDLKLPSKVIKFKIRSGALTSLPGVLRDAKEIFRRNDFLYFGYLRQRIKKDKSKIIKIRGCIYYLIFLKEIEYLNLRDLLKEVRKEEMEFTKEIAKKSGIEMDDEELYAVGNMIKEIQLERKVEEKDRIIEEKDRIIEEKDKIIKRLKEQLERK